MLGVDGDMVAHSLEDEAAADLANEDTFGDLASNGDWRPSGDLDMDEVERELAQEREYAKQVLNRGAPERLSLASNSELFPSGYLAPESIIPGGQSISVADLMGGNTGTKMSSHTAEPVYLPHPIQQEHRAIHQEEDRQPTPAASLPSNLPRIAPFTKSHREAAISGSRLNWPSISHSLGHPGLMTSRDKETIMKTHLTQMATSNGLQDWKGKFNFAKQPEEDGPSNAVGRTLYASVHHPRRNLSSTGTSALSVSELSENFQCLSAIEAARSAALKTTAIDEYIHSLHPLAREALELSFADRSSALNVAVSALLPAFPDVLSVRKGRQTMETIFNLLLAAHGVAANPAFTLRVKRLSHEALLQSLSDLDALLSKYLTYGAGGAFVVESAKIIGTLLPSGATGHMFTRFGESEIARFLSNHPMGAKLLTALLPVFSSMDGPVHALCISCERVYQRMTLPGSEESVEDLWNLLVAVLQKSDERQKQFVQGRIGGFLSEKLR